MKQRWLFSAVICATVGCSVAACGPNAMMDAGDATTDGNTADRADTGTGNDGAREAGPDAGPDATPEAGPDATAEAGPDAAPEAGPDATPEAGPDAAPDAAPEAGPDASPDAGSEGGVDGGLDGGGGDAGFDAGSEGGTDGGGVEGGTDGGSGDGGFTRYTETRIAPACDDMSTAMVLSELIDADDGATTPVALPFGFRFFGTAHGFYSVTSNGFAQLWPDDMGTPSTEYVNATIPDPGDPNNMIAPFWDDLVVGGGSVRAATLGTAPSRRFVIEWRDVEFFPAGSGATLRFQAKLFEGTNVIEFHYCTLTTTDPTITDRTTGGSATVGIENDDGSAGVQHSSDTAMSVSTTDAIRYTP